MLALQIMFWLPIAFWEKFAYISYISVGFKAYLGFLLLGSIEMRVVEEVSASGIGVILKKNL